MQSAAGIVALCYNAPSHAPATTGCGVSSRKVFQHRAAAIISKRYPTLISVYLSSTIAVFLGDTVEVAGLEILVHSGVCCEPHPATFSGLEATFLYIAVN